MGWTFSNCTRSELIRELTRTDNSDAACYETTAYTLRGNVLWSVIRITATRSDFIKLDAVQSSTFIACYLLEGSGARWATNQWTSRCTRSITRARSAIWQWHLSSRSGGAKVCVPITHAAVHQPHQLRQA
ncbi:hypothetical protein [Paraburkholderia ginsengisoli]